MPRELIVVGVDGSENSRQALRWAVEEARLRQARVRESRPAGQQMVRVCRAFREGLVKAASGGRVRGRRTTPRGDVLTTNVPACTRALLVQATT
jgi:nucleotide-binding universal stress UspA family protein